MQKTDDECEKALDPGKYEQNLLECLNKGDYSAYWQLWILHESALRRVCLRYMNYRDGNAEDALSEAMLKAYEALSKHAHRITNMGGWLQRLTRNVCIDILRAEKKVQTGLEEPDILPGSINNSTHSVQSPEQDLLKQEFLDRVIDQLKKLPDKLKLPLVLRYLNHKSYQDIAFLLKITEPNARKRIQLAKDCLRKKFIHENFYDILQKDEGVFLQTALLSIEQDIVRPKPAREICARPEPWRLIRTFRSGMWYYSLVFLPEKVRISNKNITALQASIKSNPGGWKRRWELALVLYAQGRLKEAFDEAGFIIVKQPGNLAAHRLLIHLYECLEQNYKARRHTLALWKFAITPAAKCFAKARYYILKDNLQKSKIYLERAAKLEPDHVAHLQELVTAYYKHGQYAHALKTAQQILPVKPDDPVALSTSRSALICMGRFSIAYQYQGMILEKYPDEPLALAGEIHWRCRGGLLHRDEGRHTNMMLRRLQKVAPGTILTLAAEADILFQSIPPRNAGRLFTEHVKENNQDSIAWLYQARRLVRSGAGYCALRAIIHAFELDAADPIRLPEAPALLLRHGRRDLLENIIHAAANRYPQNAQILARIAGACLLMKIDATYIENISHQALNLDPDSPLQMLHHGMVLLQTRGPETAAITLHEGWSMLPDDACAPEIIRAGIKLARIYQDQKNKTFFNNYLLDSLTRARRLEKFDPERAGRWQAMILRTLGKREESRRLRAKARALPQRWFDGYEMDEFGVGVW